MNQALTLPSIGDVVDGKFRIDRKLGEGGTSTVYEVCHVITDKKFAIKWLAPELSHNALAVERFIHEARVCGRFAHPHAVQIYDICRSNASVYLLMELLEGESLEARLQRLKRFSVQAAVDILLPCLEAVGAAHRVGIVHRDLKPSNIFLCRVEGRAGEVPKVLDFGISKLSFNGYDLSPVTTNTRTVIGTPLYMAPEQMRGEPAEPRFDIYALGIVLYELIAGQAPFDCGTFADLVFKVLEAQPRRLDLVAEVSPEFGAIVARAIAGEPEDRFATMAEFALALLPYSSQGARELVAAPECVRPSVPLAPLSRAASPTVPFLRKRPRLQRPAPAGAPAAAAPLEAANVLHAVPPASGVHGSPVKLAAREADVAWAEEPPVRPSRSKVSGIALGISLAVAMVLAWLTLAGAPRTSTAKIEPTILRPFEPEPKPEPTALRIVTAASDEPVDPQPERVAHRPKPKRPPAASSKDVDPTRANAARRVTRARAAKPSANESPRASAQQRPPASASATEPKRSSVPAASVLRIERSDFDEPPRGLSLPAAELSRQDF